MTAADSSVKAGATAAFSASPFPVPSASVDPEGDIPVLRVRTRFVSDRKQQPLPGLLPDEVPSEQIFSWIRQGEGFLGWGVAAQVNPRGPARFAAAQTWWDQVCAQAIVDDEVHLPGSGLVALGSFAFSPDSGQHSVLAVPRVILGRKETAQGLVQWVTVVELAAEPVGAEPILRERQVGSWPVGVIDEPGALSVAGWGQAVQTAIDRIRAEEAKKVVLARDENYVAAGKISAADLVFRLAELYEDTWTFACAGLVGATPELLVRADRGLATSRVLAGTIARTGDEDRDLVCAAKLARSAKDLHEHRFAVESVTSALEPFCVSLAVPDSPFTLHLPNVMHLATDIAGRLRNGASSLELAAALHPSAAVCGVPQTTAAHLISQLEGMDRGRYSGPVGWISASGDGEWGIALRCGQIDAEQPRRIRLFAGCGIMEDSTVNAEIVESEAKFAAMRAALGV